MKTYISFTTILLILFTSRLACTQTAREIIDQSADVVEFEAMEMLIKLKIFDAKNHVRERSVSSVSKNFNGITKTLIKFIAPADVKGTSMLIFDYEEKTDDMWIYLPALRKSRRILSSEKSKSFMGSEFSNADMSKPNTDDFDHQILGSEKYKNEDCWKLESKCKNPDIEDENGYSRKVAWISKSNFLCYQIEFYNFDNELFKIQKIDNYVKQSNGKYFAYTMTAENTNNGRRSVMNIENFQVDSSMEEKSFTASALGN